MIIVLVRSFFGPFLSGASGFVSLYQLSTTFTNSNQFSPGFFSFYQLLSVFINFYQPFSKYFNLYLFDSINSGLINKLFFGCGVGKFTSGRHWRGQ